MRHTGIVSQIAPCAAAPAVAQGAAQGAAPQGGWLARTIARIVPVVRRIIGVPDYDTYVRHMAVRHPSEAPLSERDFAEERMTAKYSKPGQRCC